MKKMNTKIKEFISDWMEEREIVIAVSWFLNGEEHHLRHPCFYLSSGTKEWRKKGKLHREGGPAFISDSGNMEWWEEGELHRMDGPAIVVYKGKRLFIEDKEKGK